MAAKIADYQLENYHIADTNGDRLVERGEASILEPNSSNPKARALTDAEWNQFSHLTRPLQKLNLLPIHRDCLDGDAITQALTRNPKILASLIREMGGVGYVTLALEKSLSPVSNETAAQARTMLQQWESEFKTYYARVQQDSGYQDALIDVGLNYSNAEKTRRAFVNRGSGKLTTSDSQKAALAQILTLSAFIFSVHKLGYSLEDTLTHALTSSKKTDCDRFAGLFVHFAALMGWKIKLYMFNNHVAIVFLDARLPSGRVLIESTNGKIVDPDFYIRNPQITCLQIGLPLSSFEQNPETIVTGVYVQKANDLMDARKFKEATRYLELVDQLQPNDFSTYFLLQVATQPHDRKKSEMYRGRMQALMEKAAQGK